MKSHRILQFVSTSLLALAVGACGAPGGGGDDDDDDPRVDASTSEPDAFSTCSTPIPEICDNQVDDDCDNISDCDDADCSANVACANPNCGQLQTPSGSLALPDGACDVSGACAGYEDSLPFTGFTAGQTLTDINKLLGVCINMEHSWLRDITVALRCPDGTEIDLSGFQGRTGGEVFLGVPNDSDSGAVPVPGTGWEYCFAPTATDPSWIPYANAHPAEHTLHSGDYNTTDPMTMLLGCPLNGNWTIRVEDRWGIDNGFIFNWSVRFDPSLVEDCSQWPG